MKNFENILNLNYDKEPDSEKNFRELIQKLEEEKSTISNVLKGFSDDDKIDFDNNVLNPNGLSWGVLSFIEKDNQNEVLDLINKFKSADNMESKKEIGKQIADIIE